MRLAWVVDEPLASESAWSAVWTIVRGGKCNGFMGCLGHGIVKAAPYVGVGATVVVAGIAVGACTTESLGLAGPACFEGATATVMTACGAMMGDCGPGPGGDPTSEDAGEDTGKDAGKDAGAGKQAENDGEVIKTPTAGTKALNDTAHDDGTPTATDHWERDGKQNGPATEPNDPATGVPGKSTRAKTNDAGDGRGHKSPPTFGKGVGNDDPSVEHWPGGGDLMAKLLWRAMAPGMSLKVTTPESPPGTWCVFYCADDAKLSDGAGLAVEQGLMVEPHETAGPNTMIRDLIISPARGRMNDPMVVMNGSITTSRPTPLSRILQPGMGPVHIATCREWC